MGGGGRPTGRSVLRAAEGERAEGGRAEPPGRGSPASLPALPALRHSRAGAGSPGPGGA